MQEITDISTIGQRILQLRVERGLEQKELAKQARVSPAWLCKVEKQHAALNQVQALVRLAYALGIAPQDLMRLPIPAPANGHTDKIVEEIRLAIDAAEVSVPAGEAMPLDALRTRVTQIHRLNRACHEAEVGEELPGLIRDVHTTLQSPYANRHRGELLDLAVHLHVHITRMWLIAAGVTGDLLKRVASLALRLAQERGTVTALGIAKFAQADVLASSGSLQAAEGALAGLEMPPITKDTVGLAAALTVIQGVVAAVNGRPGEVEPAINTAADMVAGWGELGEADPLGFGFGPTNVEFRRINLALEVGDPERAVRIAEEVNPNLNPFGASRTYYWIGYGRALTEHGRYEKAVRALRNAEQIHKRKVLRDPAARETMAVLLRKVKRDPARRELRAMAHRAGIPLPPL